MTMPDFYLVVTSIAVMLFTIFGIAVLVYLLLILHRVHKMLDGVEDFVHHWKTTVRELFIRAQGLKATADMIGDGIRSMIQMYQKSPISKKKSKKEKGE